ncbi:hypothetical protein ACLB2K_026035 [Fragaria x ananassa]
MQPFGLGPSNGSRAKCWFKFGKNGIDAEGAGIYGSQSRDDFDKDDVEQMGVEKQVLRAGTGPKPVAGQKVTVHCTGYGKNGDLNQKFWSTKDPGQQPFTFKIGQGSVIKGWDEGYFNYMGMLAVEGTYDKMNALLSQNIHPVDILLLMAASEGDKPKIEELLRAGASYNVKDADGRTALDRAASDEIKDFILGFSVQKA